MDDNFGDPYAVFNDLSFSPELEAQPDSADTTAPSQDVQVSEPLPAPILDDIQQEPISTPESSSDLDSFLKWLDFKEQADFDLYFPVDPPSTPAVSQDQIDLIIAEAESTRAPNLSGSFILDAPAADTLSEPQPPSVAQLPQPPIVPSQPIATFAQEFATLAAPASVQQNLPPTPSLPPVQPPALKSVTAVQMMQANDRWNAKYFESGLRSWGALKPVIAREMAREETGEVVTQISWNEAFRHLGKSEFCEYYWEQCKLAMQHNLVLEELPEWIKLYTGCFNQSFSAPPRPAAVTHHAAAQKLLNRGNNLNRGKGKARMHPAPRPTPYARH